MQLHRYDYDEIDGKMVRVRRNELYVWSPVNMETGEVDMEEPQQFSDSLRPLVKGWEWKRFTMTLSGGEGAVGRCASDEEKGANELSSATAKAGATHARRDGKAVGA